MLKIIIIIHFIYKRLSGHSRTLYRNKRQSSSKMKYTNKVYVKQIKTLQIIRESNFKRVFSCGLKVVIDVHWCKLRERAFHSVGPATLKALSPMECSLEGGNGEEMCIRGT